MQELIELAKNRIILDKIETWPIEIIDLIEANLIHCKEYTRFEKDTDKRAIQELELRWLRPPNPHLSDWNNIISKMDNVLKTKKFIAFHCSRLTQEEIDNIKLQGLQPLSFNLITEKLMLLRRHNYITDKESNYLINNNVSNHENRKNLVWFFMNSKTLKCEYGLYRLFRSWGGESIYFKNENKSEINRTLFTIGKPCIILGELEYCDINPYPSLAEILINEYLTRKDLNEQFRDFDCPVPRKVKVVEIIQFENDLFENLTNFSNWEGYC